MDRNPARGPRQRPRKPEPVAEVLFVAVALAFGVISPLVQGAPVGPVMGRFVLGFVLVAATGLLPGRARLLLVVAIVLGGILLMVRWAVSPVLFQTWAMAAVAGAVGLIRFVHRRENA